MWLDTTAEWFPNLTVENLHAGSVVDISGRTELKKPQKMSMKIKNIFDLFAVSWRLAFTIKFQTS